MKAGAHDGRFKIVRHDQSRCAAEELERADMRADPVRQGLAPAGFRIGVIRRAQNSDEQFNGATLASGGVCHLHAHAGIVDKHLLTRDMALAHGGRQTLHPSAVVLTIGGIGISIAGMSRAIFLPKQKQGDAGPFQLLVDLSPVWLDKPSSSKSL